jgi:hypothetical protein
MHTLNVRAILQDLPDDYANLKDSDGYTEDLLSSMKKTFGTIVVFDAADNDNISQTDRPRRRLRGLLPKIKSFSDLIESLSLPYLTYSLEQYAKYNGVQGLLAGSKCLLQYPAERFNQLVVAVPVFQQPDLYDLHNIRTTGTRLFRKKMPRNDWVWVLVSNNNNGDLGDRLPGLLKGLFKIRDPIDKQCYRLAIVEVLQPVDEGKADAFDTLIRVKRRTLKTAGGVDWVVNIRSILGIAHLMPYGEDQWLVNNRIDIKTWNDVYKGRG